jgi:hypothetical protein
MDRGEPLVVADPSSPVASAFGTIAAQVAAKLEAGHRPAAGAS